MPREHALDGIVDAAIERTIQREILLRCQAVHIEQRHRARGDLLGAAIGVAIEAREQTRRIERGV